jgi:endonuclease/exonuclease/phosphatase family metal-dependent hydrolase
MSAVGALVLAWAVIMPGAQPANAVPPRSTVDPTATVDVTFATFNICKVSCDRKQFSWEKRRSRVVRSIAEAAPAVVGVQEATIEYTREGAPQYLDLTFRLEPKGYLLANPDAEDTELGCTRGTHVFYRGDVIEPATIDTPLGRFDQGLESFQARTAAAAWGGIRDRCFAWAYLRHKATGAVFLAVSAHLAVEKNRAGEYARRSSARALAAWAEQQNTALGLTGLPVVLMADLNSHRARQPRGAQYELLRAGYRDSFRAKRRVAHQFTTSNHVGNSSGWPARPVRSGPRPERIDYVMARNAILPLRYEVFVRLRRDGRFTTAFRASDHNMVLGSWRLPVVRW